MIKKKEQQGSGTFIFGAEESYGYLKGTYARDKDAVVATMLICEMTAYYKQLGMTLADALNSLYDKYGYSLEVTQEMIFDGHNGISQMQDIMQSFRSSPLSSIGGINIIETSDYLSGEVVKMSDRSKSSTGLPCSDVIRFRLSNDDVIIIRPSGTEPKIKAYYLLSAPDKQNAQQKLSSYMTDITNFTIVKE